MSKQWQEYSDNYLNLTPREQYLIILTGLVAIIFITFYLFIDANIVENRKSVQQIVQLRASNQTLQITNTEMQEALQRDPNEDTKNQIAQYEAKLAKVDEKLLTLTSDLISPVQMRYALLDLLKLEKNVSLLSFELLGAQPLLSNLSSESSTSPQNRSSDTSAALSLENNQLPAGVNLYRHGFKIKLSGSYFDLQSYLSRLEQLSWKFFWQDFNFKLIEYPNSELEIQMYSLGTKKEFVGV
jgi:MSHA biogenesis protein MshJ